MVHFPLCNPIASLGIRFGRRSLWAAGFALMAASGPALLAQNTPSAADGFDPNVRGAVDTVVVQPNGQIIVAGNFTSFQPNGAAAATPRNYLARLNPDGTLDPTFNPNPNGEVLTVALQSNGQILIGGYFSTVQANGATSATTRNSIARLNADGSLDTTFDPNAHGHYTWQVNVITLEPNNQILIGGSFTSLQPNGASSPTAVASLARLNSDGSVDTTFEPNPNAQVDAIYVEPNGQILVGGAFTTLLPTGATTPTSEAFLARINNSGSIDTTFSPTLNNQVTCILMQPDGQILASGKFTTAQPSGLALPVNVDFITRLNPDGSLDTTFLANSSSYISTMALQPDGKILIGGVVGVLTTLGVNGFYIAHYLGRLNHDGTADTTFSPSPNYNVNTIALQPDGKIVMGGSFTQLEPNNALSATKRNGLARLNPDGTVDGNFDPNAYGGIGAFAQQTNGQMIIGGVFNSVNGVTCSNLARLNANGSVDTSFTATPNGVVSAVALQSDGKILIGGNFTSVNQLTANYIARLNTDGSLDTSFSPYPNGQVNAIVVQPNGQILIGGAFVGFLGTNFGLSTSYVARLNANGVADQTFQPNPNAAVYSILLEPADNAIIIAGAFSQVTPLDLANGNVSLLQINFIARLEADNGQVDAFFNPNPNNQVYSMALQPDGKILLAGGFSTLQPNPTFVVTVVDGVPTTIITAAVPAQGVARILPLDGSLDPTFFAQMNANVLAMSLNSTTGQILLGGQFTTATSTNVTSDSLAAAQHSHIVRLNTDSTIDTTFSPGTNGPVASVQFISNNQMFAGGGFTSVTPSGSSTPVLASHVAIFNNDGSLSTAFSPTFQTGSFQISTLAVEPDNKIIFGGTYTSIAGVYASNLARINPDTTQDDNFYSNPNGPIYAFAALTDGTFFAGGSFGAIGHGYSNCFAHLKADSTLDPTYSNQPNGPVNAIVAMAGSPVVIGGTFSSVGGSARANLARINTDGSVDAAFNPSTNAAVNAIAMQANGQYVVGGAFTLIDGTAHNYLARINADGTIDASFNPSANGVVSGILIQPDGKILVAGGFTNVGGAARNYLARLTSSGAADTTFAPNPNGAIASMVLQALPLGSATSQGASSVDQIIVGGSFTSIDGTAVNYLARLNYDGTLDTAFEPNPDAPVSSVGLQFDGKPLVAGSFENVGGLPRNGFARLANSSFSAQAIALSSDFNTLTLTSAGGPELSAVAFAVSPDAIIWTPIGSGTRAGVANSWQLTGVSNLLPGNTTFFVRALQVFPSSSATSAVQTVASFNLVRVPVMNSASTAAAVNGSAFYYDIAAANAPTTYAAIGLPAGLTINPSTGVISGTPTQSGSFSVTLSIGNAGGTSTATLTITVAASASGSPVAPFSRLIALSSRGGVTPGNPLIDGFVITGPAPKTVVLRGVGPGLAAPGTGLTSAQVLAFPIIQLYNSSGQNVLSNQGWDGSSSLSQIFSEIGAGPLTVGGGDAAVATTLAPGVYTLVLSDAVSGNAGGTALAEVYDADNSPLNLTQRLVALSGRANVNAANPLIGGFVIDGSVSKTILVQADGPALASALPSTLTAPLLTVYNNQGVLIAQNASWGTPVTVNASYPAAGAGSITAAEVATGASRFASGSADSAVLITIPPGVYTGVITGPGGQTGTALFEIYETP